MEISGMHITPMMITCMLQGTLCDTGIPCTFYGENICSVAVCCLGDCTIGLSVQNPRLIENLMDKSDLTFIFFP